MASALLEELKIVATEAKRSQIENAVGSSWAAPSGGRGPSRERDRNATGRSGSRRRGGRGAGVGEGGRGGAGGGRGAWGGGVGQREQWEDPMATQSDREIELSQTNRGSEESAWELYLASNQSSRAPSTHTVEEAPARSPNPRKCGDE